MRAITDKTGVLYRASVYEPSGEEVETVTNPLTPAEPEGFIGERFDAEAGSLTCTPAPTTPCSGGSSSPTGGPPPPPASAPTAMPMPSMTPSTSAIPTGTKGGMFAPQHPFNKESSERDRCTGIPITAEQCERYWRLAVERVEHETGAKVPPPGRKS